MKATQAAITAAQRADEAERLRNVCCATNFVVVAVVVVVIVNVPALTGVAL